ncbi:MAG: hypothetical protein WC408_04335 [Candidatus Micrarchaeia archaeon]
MAKPPINAQEIPTPAATPAAVPAPRKVINVNAKVRGLMSMLIGGTLVGYGMGGISVTLTAVFVGLPILLIGFTWLMD